MANYPTANPSFTTKNTGNVIQASHVNALQDEVTAIGTDLRGGLQHSLTVSTGGLTVSTGNTVLGQNLSVAGNSTVSGQHVSSNLQVDGASTFTGAVTFAAGVTFSADILPSVPKCVLTHSTLTAVAAGSAVVPSWDTQIAATAGMHSTSANSSRITFAPSTGWWRVGAHVTFSGNSTGIHAVRFRMNDTNFVAQSMAYSDASTPIFLTGDVLVRATSTSDYVTCHVFHGGASTNSITNASSLSLLRFYATFVSL